MLEIVDTNPSEPARIFLYGDGGLGKSTFGARSDVPIIVAAEKGAARLTDVHGKGVKMVRGVDTWEDVIAATKMLLTQKQEFKTVVFDSATEIERLCHAKILRGTDKSMKTIDKGWGAGNAKADSMHKELLTLIEELRMKRNVNIIITGHVKARTAKDPEMLEDYDQFEPKLETGVSGIWKEYVDACIFVRVKTFLKSSEEMKARAITDGSIVAYTTQKPAYYAKNRYNLPPEMPFTFTFWEDLRPYLAGGPQPEPVVEVIEPTLEVLRTAIEETAKKLADEATKAAVMQALIEAGENVDDLKNILARVQEITGGKK